MQASAFNPVGVLAFFRAQLQQRQPRFRCNTGELALLAPHPTLQQQQQCQALGVLRDEGLISDFHLIHTPCADAFLVQLTAAG